MSRALGKRPRTETPADTLTEHERVLYNLIRSKQDMAIWTGDMKRETNLPDSVVHKAVKVLQTKNLIKEVVNIQKKGRKHYMAVEFEPSKEISGGAWYEGGKLDTEFINLLKQQCVEHIYRLKLATLEGVMDSIRRSQVFMVDLTTKQIEEIVRSLVLDNEIIEVKSNGLREFSSIPVGKVCFKCPTKPGTGGATKRGALASIPCGVCPRINQCTPDGVISPKTCVYYAKWLKF